MAKLCIGEGKLKKRSLLYNFNPWLLKVTNNYSDYIVNLLMKSKKKKKKKISSENLTRIHRLRQWRPCNRLWRKHDG